ncbi:MAG: IcmT/TraK family protein, partial [Pseudomonadota bacterium]
RLTTNGSDVAPWEVNSSLWSPSGKYIALLQSDGTDPLLFFVMNIELWTFVLAAGTAILFTVLERKGLTVPAAVRAGRAWVAGEVRPAVPWWERRRMIDYRK